MKLIAATADSRPNCTQQPPLFLERASDVDNAWHANMAEIVSLCDKMAELYPASF